jgi:hypothetical protein
MLYCIMATDVPDSLVKRNEARASHIAYLKELIGDGRVLLAGPQPAIDSPEPGPAGMSGSLIVAEFASLEDARHWAEGDPYALAGVFESVEVRPFLRVFP